MKLGSSDVKKDSEHNDDFVEISEIFAMQDAFLLEMDLVYLVQ